MVDNISNNTLNKAYKNDSAQTNESTLLDMQDNGTITFNDSQLLNASFNDNVDNLSIADASYSGTDGIFQKNGDGTYTFSPNENFIGDIKLDYTVSKDDTEKTNVEIDFKVVTFSDAPTVGDISYTINEDNVITFSTKQLLSQSSDAENDMYIESVSYSGTEGVLSDNGDGTFSFAPNEAFNGNVSLNIYQSDGKGTNVQANSSIDVQPINKDGSDSIDQGQEQLTLQNDGISENSSNLAANFDFSVEHGEPLTLTTEDLLEIAYKVEYQEGDDIDFVNIIDRSQGKIVDNSNGTWTFTPSKDADGIVDFAFLVKKDDEFINVESTILVSEIIEDSSTDKTITQSNNTGFTQSNDGSVEISESMVIENVNLQGQDTENFVLTDLSYNGEEGTLIYNGNSEWTFWPNPDYSGTVSLSAIVSGVNSDNEVNIIDNVYFDILADETEQGESVESIMDQVAQVANGGEATESYFTTPGDYISIKIPSSISENNDVDHVVISDLPDSVTIKGGIENTEGSTVLTGNLSEPVIINLGDEFTGNVNVNISGFDSNDNIVEGASKIVLINVDPENTPTADSNIIDSPEILDNDWISLSNNSDDMDVLDDSSITNIETSNDNINSDDFSNVSDS